jgi:hypothetical protein
MKALGYGFLPERSEPLIFHYQSCQFFLWTRQNIFQNNHSCQSEKIIFFATNAAPAYNMRVTIFPL